MCLLLCSTLSISQNINQEIVTDGGKQFLVGKINVEDGLKSGPYKTWYNKNHDSYDVNKKIVSGFKTNLSNYKILLFMGTWCGDSKREVPKFIKILETANYPMENLKIVALDGRKSLYKTSPTGEEWGLQIKRIPTFIFIKNGKEVNRIVESPIESLERDIHTILTNKPYTPNYASAMKSK